RLLLQTQHGFPTLDMTARRFYLTPRTLHRRLIEEGTSYRELLEGVRHQLAVRYLETGRMTIQEISFALGYSDIANFRKAFKRWESIPPSQYQRRGEK
ncbi:MAG: AraC family transcriptional regulator, partial [Gammaproteobacteria bacterium]